MSGSSRLIAPRLAKAPKQETFTAVQIVQAIEAKERQFWTEGADFYERHLAEEAVMIFPQPVGLLHREAIISSIQSGGHWSAVNMKALHCWQLPEEVLFLSYEAIATRPGDADRYHALVTSLYVQRDNDWKLAFHQHTPVPNN